MRLPPIASRRLWSTVDSVSSVRDQFRRKCATSAKASDGKDISKYCHRPLDVAVRENFKKRELKKIREEGKLIPGVLVDSDENADTAMFLTGESAAFMNEYEEGRIHLPNRPIRETYYWGPLFDVEVYHKGEVVEHERCWLVRYYMDPVYDTPKTFTLVRRPVSEPCNFALQIVLLNIDKAPGLRKGYINQLVRVVPAKLEPFAVPPEALFVDVEGLKEREFVTAEDLLGSTDGVTLDIKPALRAACGRSKMRLAVKTLSMSLVLDGVGLYQHSLEKNRKAFQSN